MGRHKGSLNALAPLKRRDLVLYKKTVKDIRFVGVQKVANQAGISKPQVYNLINGNEGVSEQTESLIFDALKVLLPIRRANVEAHKQRGREAVSV